MFKLYTAGPVAVAAYMRACKNNGAPLPIVPFLIGEGFKTWAGEKFVTQLEALGTSRMLEWQAEDLSLVYLSFTVQNPP